MVSKAFQQGPRSSTLTTSDQRRIDARQWFCTPRRVKLLSFVRGFVQLFVNCGDISGRKSKAGSRRPHLSCPAIPKPSRRSPDGRGIKTPKVPALPIPALLCDSAGALTDWLSDCIYSPQNTHNIAQAFKTTTEACCQRGTNTYQYWPPLQLDNTGAQIHKKHKKVKTRKTQLVYKLTRVHNGAQVLDTGNLAFWKRPH